MDSAPSRPKKERSKTMTIQRLAVLALWMAMGLPAQTFPPEFRTDDASVASKLRYFLSRLAEEDNSVAREFPTLYSLPAYRVYKAMDTQARVMALQATLPLVKKVALSDAVRKPIDEQAAKQYGAVDHGLRLPPMPDRKEIDERMKAMSEQMARNPAVMQKPGFLQEMQKLQQASMQMSLDAVFDTYLNFFTLPIAEVKQRFEQNLSNLPSASAKQCQDGLRLADSQPDRFRLIAFRCQAIAMGKEMSEAEADRLRKERAQRLYDQMSTVGAIRKALKEFLRTAATVDFSAETTLRNGKKVFVNTAYEKKDNLWKLLYRNGKEPTEVVVQFAKAWLAELEPPAPAPAPQPQAAKPAAASKAAPAKAAPKK
jgi:hypothetical protein